MNISPEEYEQSPTGDHDDSEYHVSFDHNTSQYAAMSQARRSQLSIITEDNINENLMTT